MDVEASFEFSNSGSGLRVSRKRRKEGTGPRLEGPSGRPGFRATIPIVVLTDLVKSLNRRSSGSEDSFEIVRSYFVILAAWWLGIVLLLVLANGHTFLDDFFSSYVERG